MTAQAIITELWAQEIRLGLADGGENLTVPAGTLTADQRSLILAHKPELIEYLKAARATTAALLDAAMRACDRYGDNETARQQMRHDCLETPPHLRSDLLAQFDHGRLK